MTKEEIRQEAEERVNICTPYHTGSFIQGYIAGAEPRENKTADLEKQLEKMRNCKNCKNYKVEGICGGFTQVGFCKNWEMQE